MKIDRIIKSIKKYFKNNAINIVSLNEISMTDGKTNRFFIATDSEGKDYLIRLNGKLWPPFSRESERENLREVTSINPYVLYNDPENQFQISILPKDIRLSDFITSEQKDRALIVAGKTLRKLHEHRYSKNDFQLAKVVENSFEKFSFAKEWARFGILNFIYSIIASLSQNDQLVFSHNDLLACSIYICGDQAHFVDFEYSGRNFRSYDMALLSENANLTEDEEEILAASYDPNNQYNLNNLLVKTKVVVNFLLLLWNHSEINFSRFLIRAEQLLRQNAMRLLRLEHQFYLSNPMFCGVYWGTFDPPTLAHLNVAITSLQKFNLAKLIIVINGNTSTGKSYHTSTEQRLMFWQAIVDDLSIPCDVKNRICLFAQTDEDLFSYERAKAENPEHLVLTVVGQDSFLSFRKYKIPFSNYDHITVAPRGDEHDLLQSEINDLETSNVSVLPTDKSYVHTSSTAARKAISEGRESSYKHMLHTAIVKIGLFNYRKKEKPELLPLTLCASLATR